MLLWLNGTFGVGKTTTAAAIAERSSELRLFDPEWVGYMLRANLGDLEFDDFQELPPWRSLVPKVASEIAALTGDHLLAVQTVLVESYWREIRSGFQQLGMAVRHVVLDCDESALRHRISNDEVELGAAEWRIRHLDEYRVARSWMTAEADFVVDVSECSPQDAAGMILDALAGA